MADLKKPWDLETTNSLIQNNAFQVLSYSEDLGEAKRATFAAIFDMDGTLIDNTPYHYKSWQAIFKKYDLGELSKTTYYTQISGVPIMDTLRRLFNTDDEAKLRALLNEKEEFYRNIYAPFLTPINGLENFLTGLKNAG